MNILRISPSVGYRHTKRMATSLKNYINMKLQWTEKCEKCEDATYLVMDCGHYKCSHRIARTCSCGQKIIFNRHHALLPDVFNETKWRRSSQRTGKSQNADRPTEMKAFELQKKAIEKVVGSEPKSDDTRSPSPELSPREKNESYQPLVIAKASPHHLETRAKFKTPDKTVTKALSTAKSVQRVRRMDYNNPVCLGTIMHHTPSPYGCFSIPGERTVTSSGRSVAMIKYTEYDSDASVDLGSRPRKHTPKKSPSSKDYTFSPNKSTPKKGRPKKLTNSQKTKKKLDDTLALVPLLPPNPAALRPAQRNSLGDVGGSSVDVETFSDTLHPGTAGVPARPTDRVSSSPTTTLIHALSGFPSFRLLGDHSVNWPVLLEWLAWSSKLLFVPTSAVNGSVRSLKDVAARVVLGSFQNNYTSLSPLSIPFPEVLNDFDKASTIKLTNGQANTGGDARKRLFQEEPAEECELQAQVEVPVDDSEDIVPGTPTKAVIPSAIYNVMSGTKPLKPTPSLESDDKMSLTASSNSSLESQVPGTEVPANEVKKRALDFTNQRIAKRLKLDIDQMEASDQLEDSLIPNTEESPRKKRLLHLPLVAGVSSAVKAFNHLPLPEPKKYLPRIEIRWSSIDRIQFKGIREFHGLAQNWYTVGKFDSRVSMETTHLVVPKIECTPKFLMAVYAGAYVVTYDWVRDSLAAGRVLSEEPYVIVENREKLSTNVFGGTIFMLAHDLDAQTSRVVRELLSFCECKVAPSLADFLNSLNSNDYQRGVIIHEGDFKHRGVKPVYQVPVSWMVKSISERTLQPPVE